MDNYQKQAQQALEAFLRYDADALAKKFGIPVDEAFLYPALLQKTYRLNRKMPMLERLEGKQWVDARTHGEVMTLLDILCDSRDTRSLSGKWKNMQSFGGQFHRSLLEDAPNPWAAELEARLPAFDAACKELGAVSLPMGDRCWAVEIMDGLRLALCLWLSDEDFPTQLRFYWDENATEYIRYETMYYAVDLVRSRIREIMATVPPDSSEPGAGAFRRERCP